MIISESLQHEADRWETIFKMNNIKNAKVEKNIWHNTHSIHNQHYHSLTPIHNNMHIYIWNATYDITWHLCIWYHYGQSRSISLLNPHHRTRAHQFPTITISNVSLIPIWIQLLALESTPLDQSTPKSLLITI